MLFNSFAYILLFLPLVLLVYFSLTKRNYVRVSKVWLVFSSLYFYSWWNIIYLPLIVSSLLVNFVIGRTIRGNKANADGFSKLFLIFGVLLNVCLLGYFKYADFFIENFNLLFSSTISPLNLLLPLAISFFTFQQIAYLADCYQDNVIEYDLLNYSVFVVFFPQLIAGPIVHHKEMLPQFLSKDNLKLNYKNISLGAIIFSVGLFKKVILADTFAVWAVNGYENTAILSCLQGWITSLSYTFQLYFDFSGYADMAIGSGLLFNINLPINFNSPYKALDIQDFWSRWHMTLSRFLKDYIYIPLGGNRKGKFKTFINLMLTFLIGGFWHGAGWTFVFWGFLHGAGLIIHRLWNNVGMRLPKPVAWFVTFNFVNIAWVFFRAQTWSDAINLLKTMFSFDLLLGADVSNNLLSLAYLAIAIILSITFFNSNTIRDKLKAHYRYYALGMFLVCLMHMNHIYLLNDMSPEFLYFNF